MKKILFAGLLMAGMSAQAQDTYLNERLVNAGNELNGTARYVGMGGAMGALGADISCMSYNPAGIGLYRRNDIAFTAGALWNADRIDGLKNSRATLDQFGIVYTARTENPKLPFINLGFNYQKKKNFLSSFIADNNNIHGLSQMDQLAELASYGFGTDYNLPGAAQFYEFLTPVTDGEGNVQRYYNKYAGEGNNYTHQQWGGLKEFDITLSGNVNDRFYFGLTTGFESLNYHALTDYFERNSILEDGQLKLGDYSLYNNYSIDGWGFNLKLGVIVRPLEESPLRIGLAMETPTWYQLTSSTLYQLTDEVDHVSYPSGQSMDEAYLEYSLRSPLKGRLSIGSTVGNYLAWDVDYEFGNYGKMSMGYPRDYNYDGSARLFDNEPDKEMNDQTKSTLKGMHSLRAGIEWKPTTEWALRVGYNFATSPYKDAVKFDQYSLNSYAIEYSANTSYMKLGSTNTITLGLGYKYKKFYADLAYKVRAQKADFYAFDASFTNPDRLFVQDYPDMVDVKIAPVQTNLARHQLTATLGFKF